MKIFFNTPYVDFKYDDLKYILTVPLKGTDNPPGAYIFLPNGPAEPLKIKQSFVAIQGLIMQKVIDISPFLQQKITLSAGNIPKTYQQLYLQVLGYSLLETEI